LAGLLLERFAAFLEIALQNERDELAERSPLGISMVLQFTALSTPERFCIGWP
jgi:hypothetical protein